MLYEGEVRVTNNMVMTSREWAADLLGEIAETTRYGSYPHHVSAFDLGRAFGRALTNCNEKNAYKEFLRGVERYNEVKTVKSGDLANFEK